MRKRGKAGATNPIDVNIAVVRGLLALFIVPGLERQVVFVARVDENPVFLARDHAVDDVVSLKEGQGAQAQVRIASTDQHPCTIRPEEGKQTPRTRGAAEK